MTREGFDMLLEQLDVDRNLAGEKYESLRKKLTKFFGWWGAQDPDERADETFDRVAKKLAQGEIIREPRAYLMGVARLVFKEHVKEQIKLRAAVEQIPMDPVPDSAALSETREACYESCLSQLPADSRDLVIAYYQVYDGDKASEREALCARMQIPINLLRVRAFRIRTKLGACLESCIRNRTEGL